MIVYPTSPDLVNRKKQLEIVEGLLSRVEKGELDFSALEYYGIAGLGKSRVLEDAKAQCRKRQLPFAVIEFSPEGVSNEVEILRRLCDHADRFVDFGAGRTLVAAMTAPDPAAQDAPGKGKTPIDARALSEFRALFARAMHGQPLILMLDRIERCPTWLFTWLGKEFLAPLVEEKQAKPLLVFLAGRGPRVKESHWPLVLRSNSQSCRLDPLDFHHTVEHISTIPANGDYSAAAGEIYALSNGHPYSTEAIVYWLKSLGVQAAAVNEQRVELAKRLYQEVIQRYILADAEDWVLPFIEIASYFRWFTPGLMMKILPLYRPHLGSEQIIQWYQTRLAELLNPPLSLVCFDKSSYELEPSLRRLLHVALVILNPDEAASIHEHMQKFIEEDLGPVTSSPDSRTTSGIIEILFHAAQVPAIKSDPPRVEAEFERLLANFFEPVRDVAALTDLKISLETDIELRDVVGAEGMDALKRLLDSYLLPPPSAQPFQLSHLVIEFITPSQYQASWYRADQVILPAERVTSNLRIGLDEWREQTREFGDLAFVSYLPDRAQQFIRKYRDWAIQLSTNKVDVPWELLYDGEAYLCLSRPLARRPMSLKEAKELPPRVEGPLRALVVGNPTGDLPGAHAEAEGVVQALKAAGAEVKDLLGPQQATAKAFALHLRSQGYDLIHFAGHAYFDPGDPHLSGLQFADDPVSAEELERLLKSKAFIYLSGCQAGRSAVETVKAGYRGEFIEGVAASVLAGGATGCLGPMWEINDGVSKDFALAFYKYALSGACFGEAVQQARLAVEKDTRSQDCWKAWLLYGDPLGVLPGRSTRKKTRK